MNNNFEKNYDDNFESQSENMEELEDNAQDETEFVNERVLPAQDQVKTSDLLEQPEEDEEVDAFKAFKEVMKKKYGSINTVVTDFEIDEDSTMQLKYCFKKPKVESYDRYIKSMSKNLSRASRTFAMDNIVEEQRNQFNADLGKYPAAAIAISNKLIEMLGFGEVTVKKL